MPVELMVVIGAFLQELVSPLPSFIIFVPAGAALQAQGHGLWYVLLLTLLIAASRVVAGVILYWLSGKLRTLLYIKEGSWFGIRKQHIDHIRVKLGTKGSWWAIFWLWATPIVPSTLISLAAGFVQVAKPAFITATYAGAIVNALTYLLIGYFGLYAATSL